MIWTTPQPIFDVLDREFNFAIDLCADEGNAKCDAWISRETSLSSDWSGDGTAWLNPPYGPEISEWVQKAANTRRKIVGFLPGRTNAPWWHDHVMQAGEVRFQRRKISFDTIPVYKGVPPWGVVVAIWFGYGRCNSCGRQLPEDHVALFEEFSTRCDGCVYYGRNPIYKSWDWRERD